MISKWYRGHNGKQKATDNFGIIWLADNPEYAQLYADEYGNEVKLLISIKKISPELSGLFLLQQISAKFINK